MFCTLPANYLWVRAPALVVVIGLTAYSIQDAKELLRGPVRLSVAHVEAIFLMLVFGFETSKDIENLTGLVLDNDQSVECRQAVESLADP
ncbi:hypothetical protein [Labrenzia sp. CE80]|uniref:hypothetical protein n=1 Tax=Labrenzia sp. CE80 TaxID=1788986 RepID=UPI00129BC4A8|nr:hypothetical protein [Labrenzia sp. CE80]